MFIQLDQKVTTTIDLNKLLLLRAIEDQDLSRKLHDAILHHDGDVNLKTPEITTLQKYLLNVANTPSHPYHERAAKLHMDIDAQLLDRDLRTKHLNPKLYQYLKNNTSHQPLFKGSTVSSPDI